MSGYHQFSAAFTEAYNDEMTIDPGLLDAGFNETGPQVTVTQNSTQPFATAPIESSLSRALREINQTPELIMNGLTMAEDAQSDSDRSWTEEDETGALFFEIEQRFRALLLTDKQNEVIVQPLNRQQRRVVHGMAHLMRLGHETIRTEDPLRQMRIFKRTQPVPIPTPARRNSGVIDLETELASISETRFHPSLMMLSSSWHGKTSSMERQILAKRLPKEEGGFPCHFPDCQRTFDRACERRKHEKRHQPREAFHYRCPYIGCEKCFQYPKDLRRHEKVHRKRASRTSGDEDLSANEMFSDASVGSFSRTSSMVRSSGTPELPESGPVEVGTFDPSQYLPLAVPPSWLDGSATNCADFPNPGPHQLETILQPKDGEDRIYNAW